MSELPAPQKRGRADLNAWRDAQPSNFFLENRLLRALLKAGRLNRYTADLTRFGEEAAGPRISLVFKRTIRAESELVARERPDGRDVLE